MAVDLSKASPLGGNTDGSRVSYDYGTANALRERIGLVAKIRETPISGTKIVKLVT